MQSHDAMQAAHLAALEGSILALLRAAQDDGLDSLSIIATADDGEVVIDLNYAAKGIPMTGGSL